MLRSIQRKANLKEIRKYIPQTARGWLNTGISSLLISTLSYRLLAPYLNTTWQPREDILGIEKVYEPLQELMNSTPDCTSNMPMSEFIKCMETEIIVKYDFDSLYFPENPTEQQEISLGSIEKIDEFLETFLDKHLDKFNLEAIERELDNTGYTKSEIKNIARVKLDLMIKTVQSSFEDMLRYSALVYTHGREGKVNLIRDVFRTTFNNSDKKVSYTLLRDFFPDQTEKYLNPDEYNRSRDWEFYYKRYVVFELANIRQNTQLLISHLNHNSKNTSLENIDNLEELIGSRDSQEEKVQTVENFIRITGAPSKIRDFYNIATESNYYVSWIRNVVHRKTMANAGKDERSKELNHGAFIHGELPIGYNYRSMRFSKKDGKRMGDMPFFSEYFKFPDIWNMMLLEIENNRYDLQKNGFLRSWSREGLKALYMADATHVTSRAYLEIVINHANKLKNLSWTESSNVLIKVLGTLGEIGTLPITAMTTGQFKDSIVKNYYPWHCLMRCEIRQHDPRISKIFDNQKTGRSLPPLSIYIFRYAHLGPLPDYRYYSALHEFLEPIWDVFYEYIIKPVEPYLMEVGYFILDIAISKMLPYALRSGSFSVRATRVSRIGIKPRFKSQIHGDSLKPANEFSKTRSRVFSQVEDPAFYAKLKSNAKVRLEKVTSIKKSNMVSNCISSFNSIVYSNRLTSTIKIPLEVKLGLIGLALAEKQPLLPDCFQSADILNPKEFKERLKSGNELKIINEDNRRVMRWDVNGRTLASAKIHATKRIGFDIEKIDWEMPEGTHQIINNNKLLKVKDRAGGFTFRIEAQNGKIWRLSWHPSPHIDLPDDANTAKSHFNVNTTDINGNKIESHIFYKTNRGFEFLK